MAILAQNVFVVNRTNHVGNGTLAFYSIGDIFLIKILELYYKLLKVVQVRVGQC